MQRPMGNTGADAGAESQVLEETIDENYEPTKDEIEEYAKWLGMDLEADKHLFWVAREGLKAPLPAEWKPCQSPEGELYYFNFSTGESVWDHPCDEHYRTMYKEEKQKNPKPAPEKKDKEKKKRPKKSGSSGGSSGGTELKAVVAPKDRSNLASAADLLGPVSVPGGAVASSATAATAATASSSATGLSGISMEQNRGLLETKSLVAAPSAVTAAASSERTEEQLQAEFEEWEAEQRKQHEKAKADLLEAIAKKNNDERKRELNKQAGEEIKSIKIEQDKLRREKSEVEIRSPVVKPGGSGQDELERSRAEMAIEKEKMTLMSQLTAAEYEERNKLMAEEKRTIDNTASQAEKELREELSTLESQHKENVREAKSGYERAKQRADMAASKVGDVAAQKESTLLLKETERYTAELSQKLKTARSEAEAEIDSKLADAKAAQDAKADQEVKADRAKLDAERDKMLQETKDMVEQKATQMLRDVSNEFSTTDSTDSKAVEAAELSKAKKEFELKAAKEKSAFQDKLDSARTEARQGLPAAELKLKTQLSDELDELENDFRKQLEKEREAARTNDESEDVIVATLSTAKEAELRAWKEEHEKASMDGIAVEVAELQQQNKVAMQNLTGDAEATKQRVATKRASLAKELEQEEKRLEDSTARSISAVRATAQESNAREMTRVRLELQTASSARLSALSAELERESATAGAALEKERARVEAELEAARAERLNALKRVKESLGVLETAAATEDAKLREAQYAQQTLQDTLSAPGVVAPAPIPSGLQATALQDAEAQLAKTKADLQSESAEKSAKYAHEEAALQEELERSIAAKATAASSADAAAALERQYAEKREQYEAHVATELSLVRTAEKQAQEAAEAEMEAEFTALEQRLQVAMGSGISATASATREMDEGRAAANNVTQELATVEQEERMLVATIEAQKSELGRAQQQVAHLEEQAAALAATSAGAVPQTDPTAQPAREAWADGETQPEQIGPRPLGPSDANRQPSKPSSDSSKQPVQVPQQTWAEPVVRELAPAPNADAEDEQSTEECDPGPKIARTNGRFENERRKLERAKAAASKASRALQARQQQWESRRDEWLSDMRAAKRSGRPQASEFLRGVKLKLDNQAIALNAEAKKLNKKKKQIRQMTQQLRGMEAEAAQAPSEIDGGVSDALRLIDADLHQVRRSIQQHTGGGGKRSLDRKHLDELEGDSFAELQRKWG